MTETNTKSEFLYSLPGAERAFDDPAACYEAELEWDDERQDRTWTIVKWTAASAARDLPSVANTIEWVIEHATEETTEDGVAEWEAAGQRDDVKAAFRAALDLLARHVNYRLCDKRVSTLIVTWTDTGAPLLDGAPMYGRSSDGSAA